MIFTDKDIKALTEIDVSEENKIEELSTSLYARICEETERLLRQQLQTLGVDLSDMETITEHCRKSVFPDDPLALAIYSYKGQKLLGLRISENGMAIVFDVPKLEIPHLGVVKDG